MAFEEQVARGIALLDQKIPGWRERIDLYRLDMRLGLPAKGGCGCILTQLYGHYDTGLAELGFGDETDVPYGFDTMTGQYDLLTDAWKQALTPGGAL